MPLKSTDFWFWCFFLIRKFLKKYLPLAFFPKFKELRKLERPLLALQHKASEPIFWKINRFLISKSFLHQNIFLKTFRPCIFSKILETKKVRAPFGLCFSLGGGGGGGMWCEALNRCKHNCVSRIPSSALRACTVWTWCKLYFFFLPPSLTYTDHTFQNILWW
jgi:hypothetical protein